LKTVTSWGELVQSGSGGSNRSPIDVTEIVVTRLGDRPDHLVIHWWREGLVIRSVRR
jgi:hypothetical protein